METVFSHIVRTKFSNEYENIATEALAYILKSSESARSAFLNFINLVNSSDLKMTFDTQITGTDGIRPDIWGLEAGKPKVFIENKFWAGLTDNQPCNYLSNLEQGGLLLFIAPEKRLSTLWPELISRCKESEIFIKDSKTIPGTRLATSSVNATMALTSWAKIIKLLETSCAEDNKVMADIAQLKALCTTADLESFRPINSHELTDLNIPSLVIQLSEVIQATVRMGTEKGVFDTKKLMPTHYWHGMGQYIRINNVGAWLGVRYDLWKKHSSTPIWLTFKGTDFSRADEVGLLLQNFIEENPKFTLYKEPGYAAVGLNLPTNVEKQSICQSLVSDLESLGKQLTKLSVKLTA